MKSLANIFYPFLACCLILVACSHSHHTDDEDDDHDHSTTEGVIFEPEKASEFGITLETVTPASFNDVIKTSGAIEASNSDFLTATAKKSGIITLSPGLTVGSQIKNGMQLASISNTGLQGSDIPRANNVNIEALKKEYERLKPLYEDGLVTASVFNEAERAYKEALVLQESRAIAGSNVHSGSGTVSSPGEGTLQNIYVKSGDYVDVGSPVATISKNTTQILKADLPVREAKHLPEIQTANFIPEGSESAIHLSDFNGKKISNNSSVGNTNGYIPVYFSFNGNPLLSPGGFAEVYLICGQRENVISVPREALIEIQGNKYVYISTGDHSYEKKLVKTGASDGVRIEITEGLSDGDKVVSKGASIIRMAEVSSIAPPAHTHNH